MSIGNFLETLSQQILIGIISVGRLGVSRFLLGLQRGKSSAGLPLYWSHPSCARLALSRMGILGFDQKGGEFTPDKGEAPEFLNQGMGLLLHEMGVWPIHASFIYTFV